MINTIQLQLITMSMININVMILIPLNRVRNTKVNLISYKLLM